MPEFDQEKSWTLREAVMHTASKSMLAGLHRAMLEAHELGIPCRAPVWWIYALAPPPLPLRVPLLPPEQLFVYERAGGRPLCLIAELGVNTLELDLKSGKLTCWARPAPHERHVKVSFASLRVEDWACGTLVTCRFDAAGRFVPIDGGMRYYDARIESLLAAAEAVAPPEREAPEPVTLNPESRPCRAKQWLAERIDNQPWHGQQKMWNDYRADGGTMTKAPFCSLRMTLIKQHNIETRKPGRPGEKIEQV